MNRKYLRIGLIIIVFGIIALTGYLGPATARNAITTRTENNKIRLPKKVVDWEIEGIVKLGIEARTQMRFG